MAASQTRVDDPHEKRGERGGVQSIERAFAILDQIAQHDGIGLADLAKRVGLHSSTAFHIVRTMVELGIVRQAKETKRYYLGRVIFSLAAGSSGELQLITAAGPFLEDLAGKTGESSHLGLRSGSDVVLAAKMAGGGAFQMIERSGGVRPLHCTALGKVFLAHMAEAELRDFLARGGLTAFTPKTQTEPARLMDEIVRVRESGVAYDDSEYNLEVRCVAAPVYDFRSQIAGVIGISGPVWRINLQRLTQLSEDVRDAAGQISAELGFRPPA